MAKKLFGLKQIKQLEEIQKARLEKEGIGIHDEAQEFIVRLTSGGVGPPDTDDPFLIQSKALWDFGWGRELGMKTLDAYRKSVEKEGLAAKLDRPAGMPTYFNRLVLRDVRPFRSDKGLSVTQACKMIGVYFGGTDDTFIPHESTPAIAEDVRWVWCQDGWRNRNVAPHDCRKRFDKSETGMDLMTGLLLFAQDQTVIGGKDDHVIDLPGSVPRGDASGCACLFVDGGRPELGWSWDDRAAPRFGSGSCWGVKN